MAMYSASIMLRRGWGRVMQVVINGRQEDLDNLKTLGDLFRARQVVPQRVAVELNGELVTRNQYDATRLADGDRLEIVTFVGGG
ncbi:MAG: sulfur carrier protein ThiS [Planctomycetota bacterium]